MMQSGPKPSDKKVDENFEYLRLLSAQDATSKMSHGTHLYRKKSKPGKISSADYTKVWFGKMIVEERAARREVFYQQLLKLFLPHQPKTRYGKDHGENQHKVLSKEVERGQSLQKMAENQTKHDEINAIIGSGESGIGIQIPFCIWANENDFKPGNIIFRNGKSYKIDGDQLGYRVNQIVAGMKPQLFPIDSEDLDNLPFPILYNSYNLLFTYAQADYYDKSFLDPKLKDNPALRKEINFGILAILCLPKVLLNRVIDAYITDDEDKELILKELTERRETLFYEAMKSNKFKKYIDEENIEDELKKVAELFSKFTTDSKNKLVSEAEKEQIFREMKENFKKELGEVTKKLAQDSVNLAAPRRADIEFYLSLAKSAPDIPYFVQSFVRALGENRNDPPGLIFAEVFLNKKGYWGNINNFKHFLSHQHPDNQKEILKLMIASWNKHDGDLTFPSLLVKAYANDKDNVDDLITLYNELLKLDNPKVIHAIKGQLEEDGSNAKTFLALLKENTIDSNLLIKLFDEFYDNNQNIGPYIDILINTNNLNKESVEKLISRTKYLESFVEIGDTLDNANVDMDYNTLYLILDNYPYIDILHKTNNLNKESFERLISRSQFIENFDESLHLLENANVTLDDNKKSLLLNNYLFFMCLETCLEIRGIKNKSEIYRLAFEDPNLSRWDNEVAAASFVNEDGESDIDEQAAIKIFDKFLKEKNINIAENPSIESTDESSASPTEPQSPRGSPSPSYNYNKFFKEQSSSQPEDAPAHNPARIRPPGNSSSS